MSTAPASPVSIPGDLPGADLVIAGLDDLTAGRLTANALLVCCARRRLEQAGITVACAPTSDPDRALYAQVAAEHPDDPYGRYNALRRRLVSFLASYEHARRRDG
ncbi:MAG: hypothetical protein ACR2GZ_02995 [Solirubrobacteraceae bacterium]